MPHGPHAQRVHQRVALVGRIEDDLAADVRQAEAVAVPADTGHDTRQYAQGVGVGRVAEPQRVHHRDGPRAHAEDVAHDPADAGGRALVRLDVGGVVVRFDLERDRPAIADIDHAGVLPDAHQQRVGRRLLLAELPQVHLGGFVGAVLAPHHRVHGQLGTGGAPAEDVADALVLVRLQPEFGERLLLLRRCGGGGDGIQAHRAPTKVLRTEVKKPRPSVVGPKPASTACSGCGIKPTTLPRALLIPAMSRRDPLGLPT